MTKGSEVLLVVRADMDLWESAGVWIVDRVFERWVQIHRPWFPFWKKTVTINGVFARVEEKAS